MRYYYLRKIAVVGSVVCATGLMTLDCGSRLASVRVSQNAGGIDHPNLPDIFVEEAKECVAVDAPKMPPGRVVLNSTVKVNEDGRKEDVTIGGISEEASDLGACLRNALWDLPVVEQSFQEGLATLKYRREHASEGHDSLVNFIQAIPGVPIVEGELVLEAEGHTIVLPVTVKVVDTATKPIDLDKVTLENLGKMAVAALGYEEILRRAEQAGWVKTVRKTQRRAPAGKGLIGQSETEVVVVMFEVFTEYAVTAGVVSQLDSPLPGPADLAAIGLLAVGLYKAGAIAIDALSTSTAPAPTSSPPPPTPATTPTPQPAPTAAKPRRYPNQTCEDEELDRLEDEMHPICDLKKGYAATCGGRKVNEDKLPKIPCSAIKLSLQQRKACLAARWKVQNECFGGKPDVKHKEKIDETQGGIDHCEALKLKNCAKGHPMAEK